MDARDGKLTNNKNVIHMQTEIINQIKDSIALKMKALDHPSLVSDIEEATKAIIAAFTNKHKILLAGNGGSAADAQHIAGELVNRFYFDRPGLPAISLTTDTSVLTAAGNDHGFERIFARQINALGNERDVFIGISTSGNSQNIIEALKECKVKGILTIGLTGSSGGKMKDLCDICLCIPSEETPRIQEMHILIGHIICSIVEAKLFGHLKS
jgi:D-sedoheptulose 7-phosphate isomerase